MFKCPYLFDPSANRCYCADSSGKRGTRETTPSPKLDKNILESSTPAIKSRKGSVAGLAPLAFESTIGGSILTEAAGFFKKKQRVKDRNSEGASGKMGSQTSLLHEKKNMWRSINTISRGGKGGTRLPPPCTDIINKSSQCDKSTLHTPIINYLLLIR